MKKILFFVFILNQSIIIFGQNIVPNSSFENYTQCPDNENQIQYADGWNSFRETPDYFNNCSPNPLFSVPYNVSFQNPIIGNAYAGIYTFDEFSNTREIIGVKLNEPLVVGTKYYISFLASLVLYTDVNCATNNIGALFTLGDYDQLNPIPINNYAHIVSSNLITDSMNWVSVSGAIIADLPYDYLSIGNFFDDINTQFLIIDSTSIGNRSYYFIDDVCVSKDSLVCSGINELNDFNHCKQFNLFWNKSKMAIEIMENCSNWSIPKIKISNVLGQQNENFHFDKENKTIFLNDTEITEGFYYITFEFEHQAIIKKIYLTN